MGDPEKIWVVFEEHINPKDKRPYVYASSSPTKGIPYIPESLAQAMVAAAYEVSGDRAADEYDAHGQACTCRRADFWQVKMPRPAYDWRELHQQEQPRLSEGYTAIQYIRPGLYHVKGPGPPKQPAPSGDYHEGILEGWNAGSAQERRIWRMAIERYFYKAAVEGVERYAEEIRKELEQDT